MKARVGRLTRVLPPVVVAAGVLAGAALGGRPDDRAGLHGVGGISAVSIQSVRPDDRSGLLGVGGVAGISGTAVHTAIRPDDRADRTGVVPSEPVSSGTPTRPDDRAGVRGPGTTRAETAAAASTSATPFAWEDAFLGAGATFGLLMLAGAFALTLRSRGRVTMR
jgi:hypothetical protein